MQIVIDINDKEYFRIMSEHDGDITSYLTTVHLYDAIRKNSIQLPKGHGDLIDRKELLKMKRHFEDFDGDVFDIIHEETVINAPTIIPADKEEEC